jgi:hypothetical protein
MDEGTRWPMDFAHRPGDGPPLVFRPEGFLVVMLAGNADGRNAMAALREAGYAESDIKLYTDEEILANYQSYVEDRKVVERLAGVVTDDIEGRDQYLAYAREGRCALWMRIPDENDVRKALRVLSDFPTVHSRYYGASGVQDVQLP